MSAVVIDKALVAYCGLYCGACGAYRKGRCPGCAKNEKAKWCKVRSCNISNSYGSCADCTKVASSAECSVLNNFVAKIFSLIFRSDRNACIGRIKEVGAEAYATEMAQKGLQSIKR